MAEQLDLAIVLKAILDAKGFDQAQTAIKGLKDRANEAAGPVEKTGAAGKKMGESFGGTRGPIADVTRVLLQNIGVTGAAGEAAKAAGTAIYFLEGAATASTVAISASVAVIALLLPKVVEWIKQTKGQSAAQLKLNEEMATTLSALEQYSDKLHGGNQELKDRIENLRTIAKIEMGQKIEKIKEEMEALQRGSSGQRIWRQEKLSAVQAANLLAGVETVLTHELTEEEKANIKLTNTLAEKRAEINELEAAIAAGITVEELRSRKVKAAEDADDAATEAIKRRIDFLDDLAAMELRGVQGELDAIGITTQLAEDQDKDLENLAKAEHLRSTKKIGDAKKEREARKTDIKVIGEEADARAQNDAQQKVLDEKEQQRRVERTAAVASAGAQTLAALSSLFGKNKALAIAAAIADSWSAGFQVFKDPIWVGQPWMRAIAMAATVATGLAQVQNIASPGAGFDDPSNDDVVRRFGMKWANDMASLLNEGFYSQVGRLADGGGSNGTTNVYHQTTINRGTSIGTMRMPGYLGAGRTEFWKHARREMERVGGRLEGRTTLGRTGR